jgi:hypothetical protein
VVFSVHRVGTASAQTNEGSVTQTPSSRGPRKTSRQLSEAELAARRANAHTPRPSLQGRPNPRAARPGGIRELRKQKRDLKRQIAEVLDEIKLGLGPPPNDKLKEELHAAALAVLERDRIEGYRHGQLAKAACELELMGCVAFWIQVRDGLVDGATVNDRLRATENLAAKGGLPNLTQHEVTGDMLPTKLYDLSSGGPIPATVPSASQPAAPEVKE